MKCPICNMEMKNGYLHNQTQPVQWIPNGDVPSFWKQRKAEHGIVLGSGNALVGYTADAMYCPKCSIVVSQVKK